MRAVPAPRTLFPRALVLVGGFVVAGCGGVHYAVNATTASARLAEARELGAERYAPYEYYYAQAHMEQAQIEASEASYSDATDFAETAEEYALKAIEATRAARKAGRRP